MIYNGYDLSKKKHCKRFLKDEGFDIKELLEADKFQIHAWYLSMMRLND